MHVGTEAFAVGALHFQQKRIATNLLFLISVRAYIGITGVQLCLRRSEISMARVLVADDNKDGADTLAELLALQGHEVQVAYDGAAAMAVGAEFSADVALIDINMPEADGYQVARHMRVTSPSTFMVAMTGSAYEDSTRAMEAGFSAHYMKPLPLQRLFESLDSLPH
jgi:CheY-like chemotaxis protein